MSDTGGRRKPSDTAGRSTAGDEDHRGSLPLPAGLARLRQHGRRTFSADVSGAVALDEDANEKRLKMQKSVDSAYASGTSSGPDSDSTTNSLKAIWKRAISKLRRSHSSDEAKSSHASRNTSAGAQGEVDPVYSFLKLTSVIPREGASVMPDEDHYCCSKTDQDIGVVANDTAASSDPSRCQCPCHLPERLQSVHSAWIQSFAKKKT